MKKKSTRMLVTAILALFFPSLLCANQIVLQVESSESKNSSEQTSEENDGIRRKTIIRKEIILIGPDGKQHRIPAGNAITIPHQVPDALSEQPHKDLENQFFIGVTLEIIPEGYHGLIGIEEGKGVLISEVLEKSPASEAGIQKYDVLLKLNGEPISSPMEFKKKVQENKEKKITLSIRRKQENLELSITPKAWEKMDDNFRMLFLHDPLSLPFNDIQIPDGHPVEIPNLNPQGKQGILWMQANPQTIDVDSDIKKLREDFEEHQKLILKKLEDLQAELKKK